MVTVTDKPEKARTVNDFLKFMYHLGNPPRLAQDESTKYTNPSRHAWTAAPCSVGSIKVGHAIKHGITDHRNRSFMAFRGVIEVIANPQCTPPKKERIVAPYAICKVPTSHAGRSNTASKVEYAKGDIPQKGRAPRNPRFLATVGALS
jgi:hypothetical protein